MLIAKQMKNRQDCRALWDCDRFYKKLKDYQDFVL